MTRPMRERAAALILMANPLLVALSAAALPPSAADAAKRAGRAAKSR